jgi:hypothetical protein
MNRKYTLEHIEWLKDNITGCHFKDLTEMFNRRFGMSLKVSTMISFADRHGLHNGIDTRLNKGHEPTQFMKGIIPWNKGTKGIVIGGVATQFKKGNRPVNYRPVGSERVNVEDYIEIKVADPRTWTYKHVLVWEEYNGPVPKGHVVIFGDCNRRNFDPGNLVLVSRKQLVRLNQNGLIQRDADLTRSAIIMVDICHKISERKKSGKRLEVEKG